MNGIEALLKQDREAGVPEPPETAYTVAVLKRKLGQPVAPSQPTGEDRHLIIAAGATMAGTGLLALLLGANPWWLLAIPGVALFLGPILLRKGA